MKINKRYLIHLLFGSAFLCGCSNLDTIETSDKIMDMGLPQQGISIVLLPSSLDEDFKDITQEAHKEQIVCCKANQIQKKIFEKIFGIDFKSPMYAIISNDTILDIVMYRQEQKLKRILLGGKSSVIYFRIADTIITKDKVNDIFRKRLLWEKVCQKEIVLPKEATIQASSQFYDKYLTSLLLQSLKQIENAHTLIEDLWMNFTPQEAHLYKEELVDIMDRRKNLPFIDQNDIIFDYKHYNFGEIPFKNKLSCSFPFKNTSGHKMIISNIAVTCGCMAVSWNKGVINPGCTDSIIVSMKINQPGFVAKNIFLYFNSKEAIKLEVSANILK